MDGKPKKNENCLVGGCAKWYGAQFAGQKCEECERCGFDKDEDKRRKALPLLMCADGLRRIIIPAKPEKYRPEDMI